MKQILKIAVAILATVACSYSAQAQTQTTNTAETNGEMLIRTTRRHFDDFAEDAVKYGIKLTTPDGFSTWESGNTNGSTSGHTSVVTEKYMRAMYHYHPIKGIENLFVTVENGEKVAIPHGTGEALPKEMQSDESVEVYYATLEKKVQEKQLFIKEGLIKLIEVWDL